ncbi:hypothetical protein D9M69_603030 [compost metagenome]
MLCGFDHVSSCVSDVKRPCDAARNRRSAPRVLLSKRGSSQSSSTSAGDDTTITGMPGMSSQ